MRSPQLDTLRKVLADAGPTTQPEPEVRRCWCAGAAIEVIGDLAARNAITLHELTAQRASLEEAYMKLTDDAVEYRAASRERARRAQRRADQAVDHALAAVVGASPSRCSASALAAMQGVDRLRRGAAAPERAALGVAVFGVPVLMVLASMTVTGEYRSG